MSKSRSVLLVMAIALAFGASHDGELVWDDAAILASARRITGLASWLGSDLFGAASGASYWRPLTLLSFRIDLWLAPDAPERALHLSNLVWHALSAVLLVRALERWTHAKTDMHRLGCWLAALIWAVLPLKAENVAWISGRGDAMGLALLLAGLEVRHHLKMPAGRVAVVALATALALATKESLVVAFAFVALELRAEGRRWLGAESIASALVVALYLVLRGSFMRIQGGGAAMFGGLGVADRVALSLETLGHAFEALCLPHRAELLRGPIGFAAPFVLAREPLMAALGAGGVLVLVMLGWRLRAVRLIAALLLVTLLPVANIVPTGLESRMSDRFLYLPSVALALALALVLRTRRRAGAALALAAALALCFMAHQRSLLFRSSDALWSWEHDHGDRATSVILNAGSAALRAGNYARARDLRMEAAGRYAELGFAEGFPHALEAARIHIVMTAERQPAARRAYARALMSLIEGWNESVTVPFGNDRGVMLATGTAEARAYAREHLHELELDLLLLAARHGSSRAGDEATRIVAQCSDCRPLALRAASIALALANPTRALSLLASLPNDRDVDALAQTARLQQHVDRPKALFLGEAYRPACSAGHAGVGEANAFDRRIIAAACWLAARDDVWQMLGGEDASRYATDRGLRAELVESSLR